MSADEIGEDFSPEPINLLQANRNIGYSIEEAVADLIDNSVAAESKVIELDFSWNNGQPYFALLDDGRGMTEKNNELANCFRLGSRNPLEERASDDLGRFGFGLKTASLSQSSSFIVISKKENYDLCVRSLDLDFIARQNIGWRLRIPKNSECFGYDKLIASQATGTAVIWNNWDRCPTQENDFFELIETVENYISVCFHRFLEKRLIIKSNGVPLKGISPIPNGPGAVLKSQLPLVSHSTAIQYAYLIQHPSKWLEDYESILQFNSFRLFEGFDRQQGIYIYRCDRLLTPKGGWLGVIKQSNSAKLARVVIDYPNDADALWSLDITKTSAKIPFEFKSEITKFIRKSKSASNSKVVRGKRQQRNELARIDSTIWSERDDKETYSKSYYINPNHQLFKSVFEGRDGISLKEFKSIIQLISDTLPVSRIIENNDEDASRHDRANGREELSPSQLKFAKYIYRDYLTDFNHNDAVSKVLSLEPYCYYEDQVKKHLIK
jgi:hypothetical protein